MSVKFYCDNCGGEAMEPQDPNDKMFTSYKFEKGKSKRHDNVTSVSVYVTKADLCRDCLLEAIQSFKLGKK